MDEERKFEEAKLQISEMLNNCGAYKFIEDIIVAIYGHCPPPDSPKWVELEESTVEILTTEEL